MGIKIKDQHVAPLILTLVLVIFGIVCVMIIAKSPIGSRNEELIQKARLNGKLRYEVAVKRWLLDNQNAKEINFNQIDSTYYSECKNCL